ncbi:TPA: hypothetical protein JG819_004548 [Vibrio parahaemolyticus]|nr:hypothetical protein [Vibrio parahaemolyticus]HAV1421210.1 hypothetical protein [Vibrio parahaemolyticus]HAV1545402.1 hypothetical protein [Vibrio parahaemolyticus]HAV1564963.1 hypothetical protein [Vibrio parahaemolyticus]
MSTQEIGALIDSVNEMTATVAGKMGQIDKKVDDAVKEVNEAIPTAIESALTPKYYVDPVNGDNNHKGTSEATAFKTIYKAISMVKAGADGAVYLMRGTHNVDVQTNVFNKRITLVHAAGATTADTNVILNVNSAINAEYNGFILFSGLKVHFGVYESISLRKGSVYFSGGVYTMEDGIGSPILARYHLSFVSAYSANISSNSQVELVSTTLGGSYIANGANLVLNNVNLTLNQLVS